MYVNYVTVVKTYRISSYKTRRYFFLEGLQLRVLLEINKFNVHKSVPAAVIIRNAGIIRGRALYEETWYANFV